MAAQLVDVDAGRARAELETAHPVEVVAWALDAIGPRYAVACSFQAGSLAIVDMVRRLQPDPVRVLFLDTGFHFPETLAFRDRLVAEWGLELIEPTGPGARGTQEAEHGPELYRRDPDRCCQLNKVAPLERALAGLDGWMTGLRREDSPARAATPVVHRRTLPGGRRILKVNPIAGWSRGELWRYVRARRIPTHPLFEQGYASIGCAPCTRPVRPGEDARAGRWSGSEKTECGIHG
jgi:phosphoadenosine phosphosulfate reductase